MLPAVSERELTSIPSMYVQYATVFIGNSAGFLFSRYLDFFSHVTTRSGMDNGTVRGAVGCKRDDQSFFQ